MICNEEQNNAHNYNKSVCDYQGIFHRTHQLDMIDGQKHGTSTRGTEMQHPQTIGDSLTQSRS